MPAGAAFRHRRRRGFGERGQQHAQQRFAPHRAGEEGRIAAGAELTEHAAVGRCDHGDRLGCRIAGLAQALQHPPIRLFDRRVDQQRAAVLGHGGGLRDRGGDLHRTAIGFDCHGNGPRLDDVFRQHHDATARKHLAARLRGIGGADRRNLEDEVRALAEVAGYREGAVHRVDEPLGDGKTKAGAAMGARRSPVGLFELLEDALQVLRPQPRTRVGDGEAHRADARAGLR